MISQGAESIKSIDSIELKNEEIAQVLSLSQQQTHDLYNDIDGTDFATEDNIVDKSLKYLNDKEKFKEVQKFISDIRALLMKNAYQSPFVYDNYLLTIDENWGDASSFVKGKLVDKKTNKVLFSYEFDAYAFHKDEGNDYPINVVINIDGKQIYYHGTEDGSKGIYSNYESIVKAQSYKKIIENIIKNKQTSKKKK